MKGIIIFILLLLVLGLYFAHSTTTEVIKGTGNVIVDGAKAAYHGIKDNEDIQEGGKE
jgi:hypothetical protein